jgi:predicted extracellular nuclease
MAAEHYLAWWNVENLFAPEGDPARTDKLARALGKELRGWTQAVLDRKLAQLARIIVQMNGGHGPDILGVCEVESRGVLDQLAAALGSLGRDYKVVHADTKDARGIDVAFLYDGARYATKPAEVFNHFILRRNATRDLLQVNFYTKPGNKRLVLIGNHWPSRLGGVEASEPYRIIAAETLAYWHQRILEVSGADQPLVVMGDFNDEPFNRSLTDYALSERVERRVKSLRSANPYLLNLMWALMGSGGGTHYYEGLPGVLDQILVNRPLLRTEGAFRLKASSLAVLEYPEMRGVSGPRRFGRPAEKGKRGGYDPDGYSDHYPVAVVLRQD